MRFPIDDKHALVCGIRRGRSRAIGGQEIARAQVIRVWWPWSIVDFPHKSILPN
jgi:hypothetical protein